MIEIGVEIPYGERSKYINFILEVNNLIDDGIIFLCVNNVPYELKSLLVIKSDNKSGNIQEEITKLIKKYKLKYNNDEGILETLKNLKNKSWDIITIPKIISEENLKIIMENFYFFKEKKELEEKGYKNEKIKKTKNFISYAHKDKEKVKKLVEKMNISGLNIWFDEIEILPGDSILDKMIEGIENSELGILILSKNSSLGNYSDFERKQFLNKMITKKSGLFLIRIDEVDVKKEFPGFQYYSYKDVNLEKDDEVENIINLIKVKIDRI